MRGMAHPALFNNNNKNTHSSGSGSGGGGSSSSGSGNVRLPGSDTIEALSKQFGAVEVSPRYLTN